MLKRRHLLRRLWGPLLAAGLCLVPAGAPARAEEPPPTVLFRATWGAGPDQVGRARVQWAGKTPRWIVPRLLAPDADTIWLADPVNARLLQIGPDGRARHSLDIGALYEPGHRDDLLNLDPGFNTYQGFWVRGDRLLLLRSFRTFTAYALDRRGTRVETIQVPDLPATLPCNIHVRRDGTVQLLETLPPRGEPDPALPLCLHTIGGEAPPLCRLLKLRTDRGPILQTLCSFLHDQWYVTGVVEDGEGSRTFLIPFGADLRPTEVIPIDAALRFMEEPEMLGVDACGQLLILDGETGGEIAILDLKEGAVRRHFLPLPPGPHLQVTVVADPARCATVFVLTATDSGLLLFRQTF